MDAIISITEGVRRIYLDCGFSECASRMVAVYNLPPARAPRPSSPKEIHAKFGLAEGRPLVAYAAGKISFGKGAHVLFEAIPLAIQRVPEVLFVVVGSPNPAIPLPDSPRKNENLYHFPPLSNDEVLDLFSISSVVILPSTWPEPLGRVLLEAMSLSKPVVGSRVGGIPEIIEDQVTGFLIKPGDPKELADRIADLLQDPIRAAEMGQAGRTLLEKRFSPEHILPRLLSIYQGSLPPPLKETPSPTIQGASIEHRARY
jgi:glycosyltransferase involved in cell wall biosynthesis